MKNDKRLVNELLFLLAMVLVFGIVFSFEACTVLPVPTVKTEKTNYRTDGTISSVTVTTEGGDLRIFFLNSKVTIQELDKDGKIVGTLTVEKNDIINGDNLPGIVSTYFNSGISRARISAKNAVDLAKLSKNTTSSSDTETETADGSDMESAIKIENTSIRWKPKSSNTGNLVVVMPSNYENDHTIKIWDNDGQLLDELNYTERANGDRPNYRSDHTGAELEEESPEGVYLSVDDETEDAEWYFIRNAGDDYNK